MRKINTWNIIVRSYEVGRHGHVDNANIVNYLEEMAVRGSASVGYANDWFEQNGYLWVIRKWSIRYYDYAYYGDELETRTWVSDFRRVQSNREYEILRDGKRIVRARANWVFVNWKTFRPQRLLPEFFDAYQPSGEDLEDLELDVKDGKKFENSKQFCSERVVQTYELDKVWHVNNANYVRWSEAAVGQALKQTGYDDKAGTLRILTHEIEYKQGAQPDDPVNILSYVSHVSSHQLGWTIEMRHALTDELIVKDYLIVNTTDNQALPVSLLQGLKET